MLSLNRLHRFHLINYDHDVAQSVVETTLKFYRTSSPLQVGVAMLDTCLVLRRSDLKSYFQGLTRINKNRKSVSATVGPLVWIHHYLDQNNQNWIVTAWNIFCSWYQLPSSPDGPGSNRSKLLYSIARCTQQRKNNDLSLNSVLFRLVSFWSGA